MTRKTRMTNGCPKNDDLIARKMTNSTDIPFQCPIKSNSVSKQTNLGSHQHTLAGIESVALLQ